MACSSLSTTERQAKTLPKEASGDFALYAMMASNAYLKSDRVYFPIEELGWIRVDLKGQPTDKNSYSPKSFLGKIFSNLQYDIWEHNASNTTVISFKGSDEKIDWILANFSIGLSIPYKSAKKHVKNYKREHPHRKVIVTGHSLGGGLALSASVWEGVDAYVFNPSPRIYNGLKNNSAEALRVAVYHERDTLENIRKVWRVYRKVIQQNNLYTVHFNYNGESTHRADYLAEGLLRCATESPELVAIAAKLEAKVECNL